MNVAFDASAILGRSGIERYSRELIRTLLATDPTFRATLIAGKEGGADVEAFVHRNPAATVFPVLTHERRLGAPFRRLVRLLQRRQWDAAAQTADLVHILGPQKVLPHKRPLVVTIHDLFPMYEEMGIEGQLRSRFPRRIARQLKAASAVVCPSAYVGGTIREFFPWYQGPISVTPLAASDDFTPTKLSPETAKRLGIERPFVLFIGRIDGRKNVDRMLAAWCALPQSIRSSTDFVLVIAGGDGAVSRFQRERTAIMRDPSIRLLSNISTADMVQLLSTSLALVFATLGEGFGLPVIEAMKCGCPVITSSTTSLPEVGGDAALYVDPTSVDEISHAMQRCIDDSVLRHTLRESGLLQAAKFTWKATALATHRVYHSVMDARG